MASKCTASFSERVAMRRWFLSQPTARSTMLRLRYCSRSKTGFLPGRRFRCSIWSLRSGITAWTWCFLHQARTARVEYPLSPARRLGRLRGRPWPLWTETDSMSATNSVHSFTLPAVRRNAVIVPWESHTTWSLEPNPPRLRPRAWSSGSPGVLVFSPRSGCGLESTDAGAIDAKELPVDLAAPLHFRKQRSEDPLPGTVTRPAYEAVVERLPGTVSFGCIPPGNAGGENPEDAIDHPAVVLPGSSPAALGQQGLDHRPRGVGQLVTLARTHLAPSSKTCPAARMQEWCLSDRT